MSDEPTSEIEPAGDSPAITETDVIIEAISEHPLMRLRPLPARIDTDPLAHPPTAFLAALRSLGEAAPAMQAAFRMASANGQAIQVALQPSALEVVFRPDVARGLATGAYRLLHTATGAMPTAIDGAGHFVAHGRVVGSLASATSGAGGAAGSLVGGGTVADAAGGAAVAGSGLTLGAVAIVALPVVVAAGAAYVQQRQLEQTLGSIKEVVDRIEARLKDADTGVCDAADAFLELAADAMADGGLTDYLRLELAAQRTATDALYNARRRWVERFIHELEAEQIEQEKKGRGKQPWVDTVAEQAADGRLEEELILFVRSLVARSRLALLAAATLAEEGHGRPALRLIERTTNELRVEFFDLHRRLVPLARIAPDMGILGKIPGMGKELTRAHDSVQLLVDQLNTYVLPTIPLAEAQNQPIEVTLSPNIVAALAQ